MVPVLLQRRNEKEVAATPLTSDISFFFFKANKQNKSRKHREECRRELDDTKCMALVLLLHSAASLYFSVLGPWCPWQAGVERNIKMQNCDFWC